VDETILYMTFSMCLICGAAVLLCGQTLYEWKHSEQKAHEEYWRFKSFMKKMEIEESSVKHIINDLKSIEELVHANKRLEKLTKGM
jgi:hypothetical protein